MTGGRVLLGLREKIFLQATQERNVLHSAILLLLLLSVGPWFFTLLFIFGLLHATQRSPELPFLRTLDVDADYTRKEQLSISKQDESGTHT